MLEDAHVHCTEDLLYLTGTIGTTMCVEYHGNRESIGRASAAATPLAGVSKSVFLLSHGFESPRRAQLLFHAYWQLLPACLLFMSFPFGTASKGWLTS